MGGDERRDERQQQQWRHESVKERLASSTACCLGSTRQGRAHPSCAVHPQRPAPHTQKQSPAPGERGPWTSTLTAQLPAGLKRQPAKAAACRETPGAVVNTHPQVPVDVH